MSQKISPARMRSDGICGKKFQGSCALCLKGFFLLSTRYPFVQRPRRCIPISDPAKASPKTWCSSDTGDVSRAAEERRQRSAVRDGRSTPDQGHVLTSATRYLRKEACGQRHRLVTAVYAYTSRRKKPQEFR